jgi:hypothetical protein
MNQLALILLMLFALLTVLDWRQGMLICVLVGVAQDPLRKLAPSQPVYYVLMVGVIFGAAWIRAALMRVPLGPSVIHGWHRNLKVPFTLFVGIVLAQALHSYIAYGSPIVPGIGLLVWLAPIPAIVLAYQFAIRRGLTGVRRWMVVYVIAALLALSGVYFEYIGFQWRTLGEIGEGQILYDLGGILKAHSGFFRASEIAAWHTAAVACFVFTLSLGKKPTVIRVVMAIGLVAMLVTLGILTGRRKMLIEITIFVTAYVFLVAWLQRGMARLAMVVVVAGFAGYVGIVGFVAPDLVQESYTKRMQVENTGEHLESYALRGSSVFADLPKRVNNVGWQPLVWSVETFGWLGAGLGTGSQGTQEVIEKHIGNRWGAEGGLGKVGMELGVPGLLVLLWLGRALGHHLHEQLTPVAKISPQHARMAFGLLSFLIANAATFSVATQAYSDLFILLILGWCLGFLLAMPTLAANAIAQTQQRTRGPQHPQAAAAPISPGPWLPTRPNPALPLGRMRR